MSKLTEKVEAMAVVAQHAIEQEPARQRLRAVLEKWSKEPVDDVLVEALLEAVLLTNPLQVTTTLTRKPLSTTLSSLVLSVYVQGELVAKATVEAGPTELIRDLELGAVTLASLRKKKTMEKVPLKDRLEALLEETPSERGDKKPGDTIRSRVDASAINRKATLPEE